jgi:Pyridoxamine 5'-phosphate oxidase
VKRAKGSISITAELKAFLESGVSVVVGTRDTDLTPEITRAWGLLVSKDRKSISLCVPLATSHKTFDNLAGNGQIAVCCCLPTSYKTVQLKGQRVETADPSRADLAAVEKHREAFGRLNEHIGVPRQRYETFWRRELETSPVLVKLRFSPEQIFDQTPGPDAGSPL